MEAEISLLMANQAQVSGGMFEADTGVRLTRFLGRSWKTHL